MKTAVALCGVGVEKIVSLELKKLGLRTAGTSFGKVRFEADTAGLYRALMGLRAADRVLLEAGAFPADTFDALFAGADAVRWEALIPRGLGVRVAKVRTNRSRVAAETSVQGVVHKAVAGRLCREYRLERLPDFGKAAEIRVYIEKDQASLLLDLAGAPLFKRGYRSEGGAAPLRETTAAALLLLAGWRRKVPLYDPFCGSGTIGIEAVLFGWDMAPGLGREFALSDLAIGNRHLEEKIREELRRKIDFSRRIRIYGSDADLRAVSIAKANAARAYELARGLPVSERGLRPDLRLPWLPDFKALPLRDATAPAEPGLILTNPPYGKRLGDPAGAEKTYADMQRLRETFPGWRLGVVTDHPGFESFFGTQADSCRELTGGAAQSYFYQYERL